MPNIHFRATVLTVCLVAASAVAAAEEPVYDMQVVQLVLLTTGPNTEPMDDQTRAATQKAHLDYLRTLLEDGRALVIGPVADAAPVRGIVVLAVESTEVADALMQADPWIRAGKLAAEIHPWYTARNVFQKPDLTGELHENVEQVVSRFPAPSRQRSRSGRRAAAGAAGRSHGQHPEDG